jgi:molybdate transport system substrate-binding protein
MMRRIATLLVAGLSLVSVPVATAEELLISAAASLTDALEDVGKLYEAGSGNKLFFNLAASSDLARQIRAGAPADVFFSADAAQMDVLQKAGDVDPAARVMLLSNSLVVVVPSASTLAIASAKDLARVKHLALADPAAVPAGVYAKSWLQGTGAWSLVEARVVPALNVRAALAAVETEGADAGIVYKTDAASSKRVRVALEVPRDQGPKIVYVVAPLRASKKAGAPDFVRFLCTPEAARVFEKFGFVVLPR